MGPEFAIVKKGEHGCILVHRDGIAALPAYPAMAEQVIDPTGAGDSFAGGLMGHIASRDSSDFRTIQDGLSLATVIPSFVIESFSLDGLAQLTSEQLQERLDAFGRIVRVSDGR